MNKPAFDPSKPYQEASKPAFNPSIPYEAAPNINESTEAELGFIDRAKYSIEPIQSNRKAFLEEKFGADNVLQSSKGDLYVNQNGQFVPVNKEGISTADFADLAGALPEAVGGTVGVVAGAVGGGGALSIPGAIALGAAGGGVGSAFRQGLSASIGNPQVATIGERGVETGLSTVMGGVGSGLGLAVKAGYQKAKPGISEIIKNLSGKSKQVIEGVAESASKSLANSEINLNGQVTPVFGKQTAEEITGAVADHSERSFVQAEANKLAEIASKEGIPKPTYAQAAQGKALIAEAKVMDTPLIGGKVRKTVDSQLKVIRSNLEGLTGKFIDADTDAFEVGLATREYADTAVASVKKISQELYDQVEEEGAEAMIGKRTFFKKFRDYAGELGLIRPDLSPEKYAADSGLTREEFNKLQGVVFDGIDAIRNTQSDKIRFASVNALRKTVKASAEEMRISNPNAARLLKKLGDELDSTAQNVLNREHPKLGEKFTEANKNWAKFKGQEEMLAGLIKDGTSNEQIVKTVMSGTAKIENLKQIIGEDNVKTIAKSYVRDILGNLGKSGIGRADTALTAIRKSGPQIRAALGSEAYERLINNLHFLNRTGQSINVSRASLYNILDNRGPGLKGIALNIAGGAKTLAESQGTTVSKALGSKVVEKAEGVATKITSQKRLSNAANIFSDSDQRSLSRFPEYTQSSVSEREQEIKKRKRAISGSN